MFTKVNYYYFDKLFTEEFCDNVINVGNTLKDQEGIIGSNGERNAGGKDLKVRNSNVAWITDFKILQGCKEAMQEANRRANWNFNLDLNTDLSAQFTKYSKGQFYDWHCDSFQRDGRNRKLSFTLNLSDPSTYVGGEFEFDYRDSKKGSRIETVKHVKDKGSCIVFPSYMWHRVRKVTKGTRYSLVVWLQGDSFK